MQDFTFGNLKIYNIHKQAKYYAQDCTFGKTLLRGSSLTLIGSSIWESTSLRIFTFAKMYCIQQNTNTSIWESTSLRIFTFANIYCIQCIFSKIQPHLPNSRNWYPRNMSVKKIWPTTLAKLRSSQTKNLTKYVSRLVCFWFQYLQVEQSVLFICSSICSCF